MKRCCVCKTEKPLADFNKKSASRDGRQNLCRHCSQGAYVRTRDVAARRRRDRYLANRAEEDARVAAWKAANPGRVKKSRRNYVVNNRDRVRARNAVGAALRSGKLKRGPCSVCGSTLNIEAHHRNYAKPLEVEWRCRKHHADFHLQHGDRPSFHPELSTGDAA